MGHKINLRNYFLHKLFYTPEKYLVVKRKISFVDNANILLTKLIIRGVNELGGEQYGDNSK